ncbi:hypothetical protein V493_01138 [Pseudogymnoascus sp. VKM F-4281 (FW-2241)]|nr:hypothetical protein V493_01138 [Pseudogymnoascus sp. VKM F-4281 (FW-2241)]
MAASARVSQAPEAKEVGLNFVLDQGKNKVLWDECSFIWDSQALIDDVSSGQQIAIFGVKGKVLTPEEKSQSFHLRYSFSYGQSCGYFVEASKGGDVESATRIMNVHMEKYQINQGQLFFEQSVQSLTNDFANLGREETLRKFLTPTKLNGNGQANGIHTNGHTDGL